MNQFPYLLWITFILSTGCAIPHRKAAPSTNRDLPQDLSSDNLSQRIEQLESKIDGLNAKLERLRTQGDSESTPKISLKQLPPEPLEDLKEHAISRPSDSVGTSVTSPSSALDFENGFLTHPPVQEFRKALVFFQAQKYSEAILAFSEFLSKNSNHLLAGAAQYYIGESYLKQKEPKLALIEFEKFLTLFDRDAHVTDVLKSMIIAYEFLHEDDLATKHRQLLTSLFSRSPAAAQFNPKLDVPPTAPLSEARD